MLFAASVLLIAVEHLVQDPMSPEHEQRRSGTLTVWRSIRLRLDELWMKILERKMLQADRGTEISALVLVAVQRG